MSETKIILTSEGIMVVRLSRRVYHIVLTVLTLLPIVIVSAQPTQDPALQKLVSTPQYQADIYRLFANLPADVFQRCPSLVSSGSSVTVIQPTSFAADGYPISGAWKQSFPVSGCGNDTTINFYFTAQADEKINILVAAPGDTHADPTLQRDALGYTVIAVRAKKIACSNLHLRTTRFGGRLTTEKGAGSADDLVHRGAWKEIWTVAACGQIYTVPLTFIPDATGTQITAAPAVEMTR